MNERIKDLRKALSLTQEEFAKKIGYTSRGVVTNLEHGKTEPTPEMIDVICRTFDVNENWLIKGEGKMFRDLSMEEELMDFFADIIKENSLRKKVAHTLSKLPVEDWVVLEKMLDLLIEQEKNKSSGQNNQS